MTDQGTQQQQPAAPAREVVHPELVLRDQTPMTIPNKTEWDHLFGFSQELAQSNLVPAKLTGKPRDLVVVMLVARDLQISPITAMSQITVIDGVPGLSAQLMRSLVKKAGHDVWIDGSSDATQATVHGQRAGKDRVESATFTIEEAAQAGLCKIMDDGSVQARSSGNKPMPWEQFTADMLVARASSRLCRRMFEDVLMGYSYTVEEVVAIDRPDPELVRTAILPPERSGDPELADWVRRCLSVTDEQTLLKVAANHWSKDLGPLTLETLGDGIEDMTVRVAIAKEITGGGELVDPVKEEAAAQAAGPGMPPGCKDHPEAAEPDECEACFEIVHVNPSDRQQAAGQATLAT